MNPNRKTIIYLCRHAEPYNPKALWYGRLPGFPLSALGKRQAEALGKYLAKKSIDVIYSSPLERARETAEEIAKYSNNKAIIFDDRLFDVYSPTQGESLVELEEIGWNFYLPELINLGGESIDTIRHRVMNVLVEALEKYRGKRIAIVSHGDPIQIMQRALLGHTLTIETIQKDYLEKGKGYEIHFDENKAVVSIKKLRFTVA